MLDGLKRLPIRSADGKAQFHADTLFLELPGKPSATQSQAALGLRRSTRKFRPTMRLAQAHAHEMVHFAQFVGTTTGHVLRTFSAARFRMRWLALQHMPSSARALLVRERAEKGPLIKLAPDGRPDVNPRLRDHIDDAVLQCMLWFDAAERFMILPRRLEQVLFASQEPVFDQLLALARRIAAHEDDLDLQSLVAPVAAGGAEALRRNQPRWDNPLPLTAVLEAHAVVNQISFMRGQQRAIRHLARHWARAPEYYALIGAIAQHFLDDGDIRSWRLHGAVALAANVALDGWSWPGSLHGRWVVPRQAIGLVLRANLPWKSIMDRPLTKWTADEAPQKLNVIFNAMEALRNSPSLDEEEVAAATTARGGPDEPSDTLPDKGTIMMRLFGLVGNGVTNARRFHLPIALLPGEAVHEATEILEQDEDLFMSLNCHFILRDGIEFSYNIDQNNFIRWIFCVAAEQFVHTFFTERNSTPCGLPSRFNVEKIIKSEFPEFFDKGSQYM